MKTMKFLSMAALALMGIVITSCSSSDFEETQVLPQPESGDNVVTLTTSISLGGDETRALAPDGTKTFSVGDCLAVAYENTSGTMVRAVSEPLTAGDIGEGNTSATFTVTLTNLKADGQLKYIYPVTMSKESDGSVNYAALANQGGTLDAVSQYYDLGLYEGKFDGRNLPSNVTLENKLSILALTLKNSDGSENITDKVTQFTLNDGKNTYKVSRSASAEPIYVAIHPTESATIEATATTSTNFYAKVLMNKSYAKDNGYNLSWRMDINGKFTVNGKQVFFSKGNLRATTSDKGKNWTWSFAPNQWDKIGGKDQSGSGTQTGNNYINGNGTVSASGTVSVDLFGWSTSATHLGIHNSTSNSTYSGSFDDWGSASEVTACIGTGWRTMSRRDWEILLNERDGMRYIKAQVNGVNGLIVFPDDWKDSYHPVTAGNVNNNAISFESTKITSSVWNSDFEAHGAIFLPVAGQRHVDNNYVEYPNGRGHYWSSTPNDAETAYRLFFTGSSSYWSYGVGSSRRFGYSVRLVRDVK